jgi:hypothetical protein
MGSDASLDAPASRKWSLKPKTGTTVLLAAEERKSHMALNHDQRASLRKAAKEFVDSYKEIERLTLEYTSLKAQCDEKLSLIGIAEHRQEEANSAVQFIVTHIDQSEENAKEVSKILGPFLGEIAVGVVSGVES